MTRARRRRDKYRQLNLREAWGALLEVRDDKATGSRGTPSQETTPAISTGGVDSLLADASAARNADWPSGVHRVSDYFNPDGVIFDSNPPFVSCKCKESCRFGVCPNSLVHTFCASNCCRFDGACGNGLPQAAHYHIGLSLSGIGIGVFADTDFDEGEVIGEYLGRLRQSSTRPHNRGFLLKMKARGIAKPRVDVYIDAERHGNLTRFLNHSCDASTHFHELCNGSRHTIAVVTRRAIRMHDEITVDYGDALWFPCQCGSSKCRHRCDQ